MVSTPALACWCKCTADEHHLLNQQSVSENKKWLPFWQPLFYSTTLVVSSTYPGNACGTSPPSVLLLPDNKAGRCYARSTPGDNLLPCRTGPTWLLRSRWGGPRSFGDSNS